ncbi:hypothetical protein D3C81_1984980 [compost metagenome]
MNFIVPVGVQCIVHKPVNRVWKNLVLNIKRHKSINQIIVAVRMILHTKIDLVAIIVASREEKVVLAYSVLYHSHERTALITIQPIANLQANAAKRRSHMNG